MNILAIGAHPDDIEIGCGGVFNKVQREGRQCLPSGYDMW